MGTIKAVDCKAYVRTGGTWSSSPVYTELEAAINVSIEAEHSEFDATTRGAGGFRQTGVAITGLRFPITMKKDKTTPRLRLWKRLTKENLWLNYWFWTGHEIPRHPTAIVQSVSV